MIIYALIICTTVCLSRAVNHYRDNAVTYKEQRGKRVSELRQLTAIIADMQQRQRDVTALGVKRSRELANAKAENETPRADVAAGRKRLRVNASCSAVVREATGPTSVDSATDSRLTDTAERDYFILRERLMTTQKQLEGAQPYIREQCLRQKPAKDNPLKVRRRRKGVGVSAYATTYDNATDEVGHIGA